MNIQFEDDFLKALKKHSSIKKLVQKKVDMIIKNPITVGEPLKGNWQGFYSCPVKRSFIIIYLYCAICRKKNDDVVILCQNCKENPDETLKFIILGPHNEAYGVK